MRTVKFKNVLQGVMYRLGLNPDASFFNVDAVPYGVYISDAVRKYWSQIDWPEWTLIERRTPNNHVVPYSSPPNTEIDKVFKVYLVDPYTARGPIDTPFKYTDGGVHVGYDHGTYVWIKFQQPPPQFTSTKWDSGDLYDAGDLVYSPVTGECYKSLVNNNIGNDPSVLGGTVTTIPQDQVQSWQPGSGGILAQNKIVHIRFPLFPFSGVPNPPCSFFIEIADTSGTTIGSGEYITSGGETFHNIIQGVRDALQADAGLSGFTITLLSDTVMQIENASDFIIDAHSLVTTNDGMKYPWRVDQMQGYKAGEDAAMSSRQEVTLRLGSSQIIDNATYSIVFTDSGGGKHYASFLSTTDSAADILNGLVESISDQVHTDPFMGDVWTSLDMSPPALHVSTGGPVSVDATFAPNTNVYWEYVPFPAALFNQVVRDAYASALRDRGQTDKAGVEEQAAGGLEAEKIGQEYSGITNTLTDQTKVVPLYRSRE